MRATEYVVTTIKVLTTHSFRSRAECVVFYCLLVHIMYIIHNKATFIVTENINPNIRNSKNSTINTTSLLLNKSSIESGSHNISAISFSIKYTI